MFYKNTMPSILDFFWLKDKINQESWCFLSPFMNHFLKKKKEKANGPQIALSAFTATRSTCKEDLENCCQWQLSCQWVDPIFARLNRNQLDTKWCFYFHLKNIFTDLPQSLILHLPGKSPAILDSRKKSFAAVPLDPTFPSPQRNRVQWPPATTCVHMERQWKHTRVSLIGLQSCLYHLLEGKGNIGKPVYMTSLIQIGQQPSPNSLQLKGLP